MAPRRPAPARHDSRRRARNVAVAAGVLAALLFVGYAVISPIAAPWLVRRALERHTVATHERTISVGTLKFQPFTLAFEATGVAGSVGSGRTTYSFERVRIDFAAMTLLRSRPLLDELTVVGPRIEIEANDPSAAALGAELRRFATSGRFDRLTVERGSGALSSGDQPPWLLDGVSINAQSLDISKGTGRFEIAVDDFLGSNLDVDGAVSGEIAEGRLSVRNVDLDRFARRLGPDVGTLFGVLDLAGDFDASLPRGIPTVRLTSGAAALRAASLVPAGEPANAQQADAAISAILSLDGTQLDVEARATLAGGGTVSFDAEEADLPVGSWTVRMGLADLPASALDAYALRALGGELSTGRIGGDIAFTIDDALVGRAELTAMGLTLGASEVSDPIRMGLALLEDASGTVTVGVPIELGQAADEPLAAAIGDAVRAHLYAIGTTPHATLAALVGADAESLQAIAFPPGDAAPSPGGADALSALAEALASRPKISVAAEGGFDPEVDRRALAVRQVELHVLLATAGPAHRARPQPVDFASPRAQDVLDEFAGERLPAAEVAAIASQFDTRDAAPDSAVRVSYYRAIFEALAAHERIPDSALVRLGRFRAQAIGTALADGGVSPQRIAIADGAAQLSATGGHVPVPIGLVPLRR